MHLSFEQQFWLSIRLHLQKMQNLKIVVAFTATMVVLASGNALAQQSKDGKTGLIQEWKQVLAGNKLVHTWSESSSGGGGFVGLAVEESLHFCNNGQILYKSNSRVSGDVDGASASSGGADHQVLGQWQIVDADAQKAALEFAGDNGAKAQGILQVVNNGLYLGRKRVSVNQSELC